MTLEENAISIALLSASSVVMDPRLRGNDSVEVRPFSITFKVAFMRTIPPNLAAHLTDGATTLCHCWKLIRRDGTTFGFTDHDRDLVIRRHDLCGAFRPRSGGGQRRTRLRRRRRRGRGRARLRRHHRGRYRLGALRRCERGDLARELEQRGGARAARYRLHRRDPAARMAASSPRCAGSCTASTRSAGGSFAPPARPISATSAAASISPRRPIPTPARSRAPTAR